MITETTFNDTIAEIAALEKARASDQAAFLGNKHRPGAQWDGQGITRAKQIQTFLQSNQNQCPAPLTEHWREAILRVGGIVNG